MTVNANPQFPLSLTVEQILQQAVDHYRAGRYWVAEALYRGILQGQPGHAEANHNLGVLLRQRDGAAGGALEYLKRALEADPSQGQYWLSYIDVLLEAGQPDAAWQVLAQGRARGLAGPQVEELASKLGGGLGAGAGAGPTRAEVDQVVGLFGQGRYADVEPLARALTQRYARHGFGWKVLGAVLKQLGRDEQALAPMQTAAALLPKDFEAHHNLGLALADTGRLSEAEASYRRALELKPEFAEAHYDLGNALKRQGRLSEAEASFRQAVRIRPKFALAHYNLGNTLAEQGHPEQAEASLRRALELEPELAEAHGNLGSVLRTQGRLPQAEASYLRAVELKPEFADAYANLGAILYDLGRLPEAASHCRRALEIDANHATAHCNLGNILAQQEQLAEAEKSFRRAIEIKPDFADAYCNLGNALIALGRPEEAEPNFRRALEFNPRFANAYFCLGNVLKAQDRWPEAEASYRRALELKPDYDEAYYALGNLLTEQWRLPAAEACYQRALEIDPEFADAHINLGNTFMFLGRLSEAEVSHRRALDLDPNYAEAHNNLGLTLIAQGRLTEAEASCRQALVLKPDFAAPRSNLLFALNYDAERGAEEIYEAYRQYDERFGVPLRAVWREHGNSREAGRRLKVGYVSPDFRKHAVSLFLEPLLGAHDKAVVEVYAYAELRREDAVSARYKGYVDHWVGTVGLSDEALAERIRADGIDVLVDVAGHTTGNRLGVFARKPAPVSVSWLGYGYTTGLSAIDYFLTDEASAPAGSEGLFSEAPWRVATPVYVYRPAEGMGEVSVLPVLERGYITFGTLTRAVRINHRTIRVWSEILKRVAGSHLVIDSANFQERAMQEALAQKFAAHGIERERLQIGYHSPPWDVLRGMDIGLDCFPHNSGTTLFETLYMGVPYVTLAGRPSVGRLGSSILQGVGHAEWIARSEEEYVEKVVELASDVHKLAGIRGRLRRQMQASALMDETGFARKLEAAYREMFARWVNSQSAQR